MDLRPLAAAVLFGTAATAQIQDPDRPKPTPAQQITALEQEKARLQREIDFVKARASTARTTLADKLGKRAPGSFKSIDAGTAYNPAAQRTAGQVPRRFARVATAEEFHSHPQDTMLLVNGHPISAALYERLVAFLREVPGSGDDKLRGQRALFDLIRIQAVAGAFAESDAEGRLGDLVGDLESGASITDLARKYGTVTGGSEDGRVEVRANSIFGPVFEQIAFSTPPGTRSRPFQWATGYCVLQVDEVIPATATEPKRVVCHAAHIPYSSDQTLVQNAQIAISSGQIEILARDEQVLDVVPVMFRDPKSIAPVPVNDPAGGLQQKIAAIEQQIAKFESADDEESRQRLEVLRKELELLREQLRGLQNRLDIEPAPARQGDAVERRG